jgi:hypothetical protein
MGGPPPPKKSKTALIIAIVCGLLVLAAGVVLAVVLLGGDDKASDRSSPSSKPSASASASPSASPSETTADGPAAGMEEYCSLFWEVTWAPLELPETEYPVYTEEMIALYDKFIEAAPEDSKEAIQVVRDYYANLAEAVGAGDTPEMPDPSDTAAMEAYLKELEKRLEQLDTADLEISDEFIDASVKLSSDAMKYCGNTPPEDSGSGE